MTTKAEQRVEMLRGMTLEAFMDKAWDFPTLLIQARLVIGGTKIGVHSLVPTADGLEIAVITTEPMRQVGGTKGPMK